MIKKYLDYLLMFLITLVILLCLYFSLFFYQLGTPLCKAELWIQKAQTIKRNSAEAISGQKLIIVAGSNAFFGIDSSLLTEKLDIPTVNLSIHAGLGIKYILNEAKLYSNPGDIILLLLEYELYGDLGKPSTIYLSHILELDTPYFNSLQLPEKLTTALAFGLPDTFSGVLAALNNKNKNCEKKLEKKCYSGLTIDSSGDEQCNQISAQTEAEIKRLEDDIKFPRKWTMSKFSQGILSNFIEWTQQNDIKLLVSFPSTVYFQEYENKNTRKFLKIINNFYHKNNIIVLGNPYFFMYDKKMFFDTYYHLNNKSRTIRTKQLIELIKSADIVLRAK